MSKCIQEHQAKKRKNRERWLERQADERAKEQQEGEGDAEGILFSLIFTEELNEEEEEKKADAIKDKKQLQREKDEEEWAKLEEPGLAYMDDMVGRYIPGWRHYENYESYVLKYNNATIQDYVDDINRQVIRSYLDIERSHSLSIQRLQGLH